MSLVYLPVNDFKNIGGPTTFIRNLSKYFNEQGVDYTTDDHQNAQSILFPISYKTATLKQYKNQGKPIIQRLDGLVGFPWQTFHGLKSFARKTAYETSWVGPKRQVKFLIDMIQINNIYRNYTDLVIFQSEYCRDLCFDMMKPLSEDKYRIIYNGVHSDLFYPGNYSTELSSLPTFVITGRFRREDMLYPVLDALDIIQDKYEFKLKVIGPIEHKKMQEDTLKRKYVEFLGPKNTTELAAEIRNSDLYIFSSLNAPCPNALLEAVASGLPVISYNYGSVAELLNFNLDLVAPTMPSPNPLLKGGEHLNAEALADKLELALNNYSKYKQVALDNSKNYSFEKCGESYLEAIKSKLKS